MFTHVMVGADDIETSTRFYDATLGALGIPPGARDDQGRVFWRTPTGVFAITAPLDGEPAVGANGGTIGFAVGSPKRVAAWHAAGLASGGRACEDPPGVRDAPQGTFYLAYLLCVIPRATSFARCIVCRPDLCALAGAVCRAWRTRRAGSWLKTT